MKNSIFFLMLGLIYLMKGSPACAQGLEPDDMKVFVTEYRQDPGLALLNDSTKEAYITVYKGNTMIAREADVSSENAEMKRGRLNSQIELAKATGKLISVVFSSDSNWVWLELVDRPVKSEDLVKKMLDEVQSLGDPLNKACDPTNKTEIPLMPSGKPSK